MSKPVLPSINPVIEALELPTEPVARRARLRETWAKHPNALALHLARSLGVSEREIVEAMPDGRSIALDASGWEAILRGFESLGDVHVVCTNSAVTLEAFGQFGNFSTFGGYFNVQTRSLDMHIRHDRLARIYAVRKPSHMDGVETLSVQFFDVDGTAVMKVFLTFGGKTPASGRVAAFDEIVARFGPHGNCPSASVRGLCCAHPRAVGGKA
ncbi:MAG: ChuX/HutX family heme-like substrate-binding protein [Tepidisphaeraceae bacterium]